MTCCEAEGCGVADCGAGAVGAAEAVCAADVVVTGAVADEVVFATSCCFKSRLGIGGVPGDTTAALALEPLAPIPLVPAALTPAGL